MNSSHYALKLEYEDCDFRNACWGMSKQGVKMTEPSCPSSEGHSHLSYSDYVIGLESVVGFHFIDNSLVEAGYAFREQYDQDGLYLKQYEILKGHFSRSYGEPYVDEDINTLCGNSHSCEHEPLESLMLLTEWFTERSIIRMILMGNSDSCEFGVLHLSRGHLEVIVDKDRTVKWGNT